MSSLTADIICRTVFSTPLESDAARNVFDAFTIFERSVAHVEIRRLIMDPALGQIFLNTTMSWMPVKVFALNWGRLVDGHLEDGADFDDIAMDDHFGGATARLTKGFRVKS